MRTAVAIALYNGERFLEEQLDSIRLQTRKPDQVILCDDCSKDNTVDLVRDYICKYNLENSWTLYQNEQNLGYIRNFYRAISLCESDLVFLCDQDDIWKDDKIERMTKIMEQRSEILLLSCRYGIIDAQNVEQHSIVERRSKEDGSIRLISVENIMQAYRWPGMLMCIRKDFFVELIPYIENCAVAHDLILAVNAADRNGFYECSYIGAFHRRHENNTAREEHRLIKLLNRERKLTDISITKKHWRSLAETCLPVSAQSHLQICERLNLMEQRESALQSNSLKKIVEVYKKDGGKYLRVSSLLCDLWLVCFGSIVK